MNMKNTRKYLLSVLILLFSSELLASAESDYKMGVEAYKVGDTAAAINYFETARKQGMDSLALQYNLASSYYRAGQYAEAKMYFKQLQQSEEMRDLSGYHLGLIAISERDGTLARQHFNAVVSSGKDKKLVALSEKHLNTLRKKQARWKSHVSLNLGHDDNISSVSGDSVLDRADTFYQLFASADLLIAGGRRDGWMADASLYGIEFSETDSNDEYHFSLGLKKAMQFKDWDSSAKLSLSKSTYGGDDFQSITKLDINARKPISKSERLYLRYRAEDIKSDNALYDYLEGTRQRGKFEYRNYSQNNIKQLYYELELNDRGELVTLTDSYDYSPTRHTIRGKYTHIINKKWWLIGDLSYRLSDFPASLTTEREDKQWKLGLSADYHINKTLKLISNYQYIDNASTLDQYNYDKSIIKIGLRKLF